MRVRFVVVGALLSMTGAAFAADLPTAMGSPPARIRAATPTDWSGIYGDLGLGWGDSTQSWRYLNPDPSTLTPFSASADSLAGLAIVGAQKQLGNFVIGAEAGAAGPLTGGYAGTTSNGTATSVCTEYLGERCESKIDGAIAMVGPKTRLRRRQLVVLWRRRRRVGGHRIASDFELAAFCSTRPAAPSAAGISGRASTMIC